MVCVTLPLHPQPATPYKESPALYTLWSTDQILTGLPNSTHPNATKQTLVWISQQPSDQHTAIPLLTPPQNPFPSRALGIRMARKGASTHLPTLALLWGSSKAGRELGKEKGERESQEQARKRPSNRTTGQHLT